MTAGALYPGTVVHKRLTPRRHAFSYRVFALLADVDAIDDLDRRLRFFSRNRFNLISLWDRDMGRPGGGTIADKARAVLAEAGMAEAGARIELLCYPRVLGYVFNPLSVYFCHDPHGRLAALIYEVSNTFGERKSYAVEVVRRDGDAFMQSCRKEMYVSPFTEPHGVYGFHVIPPGPRVVVGVDFRNTERPVLKTHFRGERCPLDDATILRFALRYPLMTLKVMGAIHLQAARLWLKGVPLVVRHTSPRYSVSKTLSHARGHTHA